MPDNLPPRPVDRTSSSSAATEPAADDAAAKPKSHPIRNILFVLAGVVCVVLLVAWLIDYLLVGQYFVSTDDAYIAADSSMIASKISGYVIAVPVNDNQLVGRGQVLALIDPRDYQLAVTSALANQRLQAAAMITDTAQLALQQTRIDGAAAMVAGDEARARFAMQNHRRYASLSGTGASTEQSNDQASTDLAAANAALAADNAALLGARRQVDVLNAQLLQAAANIAQARGRVAQAELDLSHASIAAPFAGMVGDKTVQVGDYISTGTQLMALVPLAHVYILANYKETQITHLVAGQKVRVDVDGFPDLKVTGTVDSISPASGQEFALLPPDNATGNFTKIVQRVPVKIRLNLDNNLIGKLRPGMSVEPDIDIRSPKG